MNNNIYAASKQLNGQLSMEREQAKRRRQQVWAARKEKIEAKATLVLAQLQFSLMNRADGTS